MVVGDAVPLRQRLQIGVIGDHGHHVHRQLADALAIEQVVEAVVGFGHHDQHFWPMVWRCQFESHAKGLTAFGQACAKFVLIEAVGLAEFDADKKPR